MRRAFSHFLWEKGVGGGDEGYIRRFNVLVLNSKLELTPPQSSSFDLFKPLMRQSSRIHFFLFTYRLTPLFLNLVHVSKLTLSFLRKPRKLIKGMHLKNPAVPKTSGEKWPNGEKINTHHLKSDMSKMFGYFWSGEKFLGQNSFIALCFAGSVSWWRRCRCWWC